jgi:acetylornithine deacetylase/succinyl-diaminopimelate desuccinylase-like protein
VLGGGTDAKAFSTLGIDCYGFVPSRHPSGFPTETYVHGVDEQVPVDSLVFGLRVLDRYLRSAPSAPPSKEES